jgi:uncharacterized protein YecE (DUF72 family)
MGRRVRIGTSGWEYEHWKGPFYPRDLPRDRWLEFYSERFDTVELNATFYRLPEADTFARWGQRVPSGFRFAIKASRYLTHLRRLRAPDEPLDRLWTRARRLGQRRGPMLYQLPPRWRPNPDRLAHFLATIPQDEPQAVEIRDRSWYRRDVLDMLEAAGVALVLHDMPESRTPLRRVGPIVYLRFHGAGERYGGAYSAQRLSAWARRITEWAEVVPVWAYFNNDMGGNAVRDADRLRRMVERRRDPG